MTFRPSRFSSWPPKRADLEEEGKRLGMKFPETWRIWEEEARRSGESPEMYGAIALSILGRDPPPQNDGDRLHRIAEWNRNDITKLWELIDGLSPKARATLTPEMIPTEPIPADIAKAAKEKNHPIWARDKEGSFLTGRDFDGIVDEERLWEEFDIIDFVNSKSR